MFFNVRAQLALTQFQQMHVGMQGCIGKKFATMSPFGQSKQTRYGIASNIVRMIGSDDMDHNGGHFLVGEGMATFGIQQIVT